MRSRLAGRMRGSLRGRLAGWQAGRLRGKLAIIDGMREARLAGWQDELKAVDRQVGRLAG